MTRPSLPAPGRIAAPARRRRARRRVRCWSRPRPASAADGLKMDAHALLQGHVRAGSWFGIAVDLQNDGPTVTGELRISGGADSRTRFGTPVELATGSRKQYVLYALPPTFGGNMTVELVERQQGRRQVARSRSRSTTRPSSSSASWPRTRPGSSGSSTCCRTRTASRPSSSRSTTADLPERVQAWAPLDRLIWQDVDAASLTPGPARGHAHVDRRRRAARDRRRHGARRRADRRSPTTSSPTGRPASSTSTPARLTSVLGPIPAARDVGHGLRGRRRRRAARSRRPATGVDRGGPDVRLGRRDAARLRPRDRSGSRTATPSTSRSGAGSCRRAPAARCSLRRRPDHRQRGHQPAQPRAAADRRPARPAARATSCSSAP